MLIGAVTIISPKFLRCGFLLVVLDSRHAFLFEMTMKCWLWIADDEYILDLEVAQKHI
jgi:protein HIRA/HIR1